MKLSVVSTMYLSAKFLPEFCRRSIDAASRFSADHELILVNDGSPDNSLDVALAQQAIYPAIKIVDLSRNFGHHAAIVAGVEHAVGELVFLIDCDLEEQPEWLERFHIELTSKDIDVVFGSQEKRVSSGANNVLGSLFWKLLNVSASVQIPHNPMTCRLMTRRYVDALLRVEDRVLYLAGVFAWAGFQQAPLALVKTPRTGAHKSTYSLSRKLLQTADSFASFSSAPLTMIFLLGLAIWIGSMAAGTYLGIEKLIRPTAVLSGFTSMMLSIWFLSGTIIMTLGILGIYISKIFQEVKRRPQFIVRKVFYGRNAHH